MQPPGLRAVEIARANGQWDKAYAGGMAKMETPPELLAALASAGAQALWERWTPATALRSATAS